MLALAPGVTAKGLTSRVKSVGEDWVIQFSSLLLIHFVKGMKNLGNLFGHGKYFENLVILTIQMSNRNRFTNRIITFYTNVMSKLHSVSTGIFPLYGDAFKRAGFCRACFVTAGGYIPQYIINNILHVSVAFHAWCNLHGRSQNSCGLSQQYNSAVAVALALGRDFSKPGR